MNILFITSWFPSRVHATDGNFVEKHARLVARDHNLTVLHVQPDPALPPGQYEIEQKKYDGFLRCTVYYGLPAQPGFWRKRYVRWRAYQKAWRHYAMQATQPDILHAHILLDAGIVAAYWSRRYGLPLVLTEHSSVYHNGTRLGPGVRWLMRWATRQAQYLLPVSHSLQRSMQAIGIQGRWQVVPNSVDTHLFSPVAPPPRPPFRFLHISNFAPGVKNTEGIIRAFAQLLTMQPSARLTIAGDGDLAPLRAVVQEAGLTKEQLTLLGTQSEAGVARLMQSHHAFVLFSNYENLPVVLLEAQCCGLPLMATAVGGVGEIITNPAYGLLIPRGDTQELCRAMYQVLDNYTDYSPATIAATGRQRYAEAVVAATLHQIYQSICPPSTDPA